MNEQPVTSVANGSVMRFAMLSTDGRYRYELRRDWATPDTISPGRVLFVMLNPSTADGTDDDPTIRRCLGFARREGMTHLDVVNLYAYRATEPRDMWAARSAGVDIIGPDNDQHVTALGRVADLVVCAWGKVGGDAVTRVWDVVELLRAAHGKSIYCLGTTKHGHPRHPLYVPAAAPLEVFDWPPVTAPER